MIKTLEFFGGVGAPRKSFINLGVDIKAIDYVEIDEKAVRTYNSLFKHYYKPTNVIGYNLKPDILIHGSPCQDFSRAGKRLGGTEDKTRSGLMFETIKIIENMGVWKPKVVIWENVKGVLDKDMIHSFMTYIERLNILGYSSCYKVLNAMDFGLPQKRERVFTISILGKNNFNFDNLKTVETKPISEFLESNVDDIYTIKSPSMLSKINVPNIGLKIIKDHCWTITTNQNRSPNSGIIDLQNGQYRLLTEKECWRLMGFNDQDFEKALSVHPTKDGCRNPTLYKQSANSIAVPILEAIFKELLENQLLIK